MTILEDMSHGPVIMLAIDRPGAGYTYVDASRPDSDAGAGVEVSTSDGGLVELGTPEEVDALVEALQIARREVWG
jgi:hypothetical protein